MNAIHKFLISRNVLAVMQTGSVEPSPQYLLVINYLWTTIIWFILYEPQLRAAIRLFASLPAHVLAASGGLGNGFKLWISNWFALIASWPISIALAISLVPVECNFRFSGFGFLILKLFDFEFQTPFVKDLYDHPARLCMCDYEIALLRPLYDSP